MTITLRISETGEPVGAGHVATYKRDVVHHQRRGIVDGARFEVDNWSEGTLRVYARPPGHTPKAPLVEFRPSELGLYIGHEHGQHISEIKWASGPPRRGLELDEAERALCITALEFFNRKGVWPSEAVAYEATFAALIAKLKGV